MSQLGRMQLAALKRMEMSLNPLKRKLDFIDKKINALIAEKAPVQAQFDQMEEMMNNYAGGVPYEQVLHPEMAIAETITDTVDAEATVEMVQAPVVEAAPQEAPADFWDTPVTQEAPAQEEAPFTYPGTTPQV